MQTPIKDYFRREIAAKRDRMEGVLGYKPHEGANTSERKDYRTIFSRTRSNSASRRLPARRRADHEHGQRDAQLITDQSIHRSGKHYCARYLLFPRK